MPIIKSAIKKLRKDKARTLRNKKKEEVLKALIKKVRKEKTPQNLQAVYSALDKASKVNLIHKNKAARLKSRLSKGIKTPPGPIVKKSSKKPISKKASKPKK